MKLESLENYKKDTSYFRVFAVAIIVCSILGNILLYYLARLDVQEAYEQIWVVDKSSRPYLAEARNQYNYEERLFEYEEAVREFYENAFSCDDSDIHENYSRTLERALHLSVTFDNGQTLEDFWWEEKIIGNVLENNWIYKGRLDSVLFDQGSSPMKGYAFGKQQIKMRRQELTRNLNFSFIIYDVSNRTRQNPFAVKLDELDIFNNTVITSNRE